jgi:hypothetical protein
MASSLPSPNPKASVWATMLRSMPIVILKYRRTTVFSNSNYSTVKALLMLSKQKFKRKELNVELQTFDAGVIFTLTDSRKEGSKLREISETLIMLTTRTTFLLTASDSSISI